MLARFFSLFLFLATIALAHAQVVVSADKMNILYRGIDNPISVAAPGIAASDLNVTINEGHELKSTSPGKYVITPGSPDEVSLSVISDGTLITTRFRVLSLPLPKAVLAGVDAGTISMARLMSASVLGARMAPTFDFDVTCRVTAFDLAVAESENARIYQSFHSDSNRMTDEMREAIANVSPGNLVHVGNIQVEMPDGVRQIEDATWVIE